MSLTQVSSLSFLEQTLLLLSGNTHCFNSNCFHLKMGLLAAYLLSHSLRILFCIWNPELQQSLGAYVCAAGNHGILLESVTGTALFCIFPTPKLLTEKQQWACLSIVHYNEGKGVKMECTVKHSQGITEVLGLVSSTTPSQMEDKKGNQCKDQNCMHFCSITVHLHLKQNW